MTAKDLKDYLTAIEERGEDLNNLPLVFIERELDRYAGRLLMSQYVQIVNVESFNNSSDTTKIIISPLYKKALVLGPIIEIN